MSLLFYVIYVVWFSSEVLLNRLFIAKGSRKKNLDKNSLALMWITITAANFAGIYMLNKFNAPIAGSYVIPFMGLAMILSGVVFRMFAIRKLGKFFNVNLTIHEDHQLVKTGIYKILRHPSYTGSLVSFLGFGISLNNWISSLIIFIPVFLIFVYRMNIEEKLLQKQFGEEYTDYMKSTYRLLPGIY